MRGLRRQNRTYRWLMRAIAACLAGFMSLGFLAACGDDLEDVLVPTERGPIVKEAVTSPTGFVIPAGTHVCLWIEVRDECKDSGVPEQYWLQSPEAEPAQPPMGAYSYNNFWYDMFMYRMMYDLWFGSPGYYNVYVPASYRSHYQTRSRTFSSTYKSKIDQYKSQAHYKSRSTGKVFTGSQVDPKKFAPLKNNGGDRRSKACNAFILNSFGPAEVNMLSLDAVAFANRTLETINPTSANFANASYVITGRGGGGGRSSGSSSKSTSRSGSSGSKSTTNKNSGGDRGKGGTSKNGC